MKIIRCLIAVSLALPSVSAVATAPALAAPVVKSGVKTKIIKKSDINAMLLDAEKAANNRDLELLMVHLAPDLVVKITAPGQPTMTLNRAQYKTITSQVLEMSENYQYKRLSTQIVIAPNGKSARVVTTTHEKMTINSQQIQGTAKSTSIFQVRGNRILITSITATTTMSVSTEV